MSQNHCRIHIRREALKFSSAHMTVFADGSKEALHGHNYLPEVSIDLRDTSFQKMVSFSLFKKPMKEICDAWDEKVLLASACPLLQLKTTSTEEVEFVLCRKRYVLPADEVVFLNVDNITCESLAEEFCREFISRLDPKVLADAVARIQVKLEESPGQGATFFWEPL